MKKQARAAGMSQRKKEAKDERRAVRRGGTIGVGPNTPLYTIFTDG
jgi:hypothetical protein